MKKVMIKGKPIIGITLDHQENGGYSNFAWYALRENYFHAVINTGGLPIGIPFCIEAISYYINMIDGLIIPGGKHDIDPKDYGEAWVHERVEIKSYRSNFD